MLCPFCKVPHPIFPHREAECGTYLELTAVQSIVSMSKAKQIQCIKCGKPGGTMVKSGDSYIHAQECAPNKVILTEMPKVSRLAQIAYNLPPVLQNLLSKKYGRPSKISMIDNEGNETGDIAGYYFHKV